MDNYNTVRVSDDRLRMHGKWVNYFDQAWKTIDLSFRNDGSNFLIDKAPFSILCPSRSNGICYISINNKYDIFDRTGISEPDMVFEVTAENTHNVSGVLTNDSQVWYHDAFATGVSLRYTAWYGKAPRVTKEVVIDPTVVSQQVVVSWLITNPNALTLINGARPLNPDGSAWTGVTGDTSMVTSPVSIHYFDGDISLKRGSGFKRPVAWYYNNGKMVVNDIDVQLTVVNASTIRVTKTIPISVLNAARQAGSLVFADDTTGDAELHRVEIRET